MSDLARGIGAQYLNTNAGTQNNNTGSGTQYNAQTQNFYPGEIDSTPRSLHSPNGSPTQNGQRLRPTRQPSYPLAATQTSSSRGRYSSRSIGNARFQGRELRLSG
jgi:hypothetical protein